MLDLESESVVETSTPQFRRKECQILEHKENGSGRTICSANRIRKSVLDVRSVSVVDTEEQVAAYVQYSTSVPHVLSRQNR